MPEKQKKGFEKIDWNQLHSMSFSELRRKMGDFRGRYDLDKLLHRSSSEKSHEQTESDEFGFDIIAFALVASALPLKNVDPDTIHFRLMTRAEEQEYRIKHEKEQRKTVMVHLYWMESEKTEIIVDPEYCQRFFNELRRLLSGIEDRRYYKTVGDFIASIAHEIGHNRHLRQNKEYFLANEESVDGLDHDDLVHERNTIGYENRFIREILRYGINADSQHLTQREEGLLDIIRKSVGISLFDWENGLVTSPKNAFVREHQNPARLQPSVIEVVFNKLKGLARR